MMTGGLAAVAHPGAAAAQFAAPYREDAGTALSRHLRALGDQPRSIQALLGAGNAALELGDAQAALTFFARAEEVAPRDPRAKAGMGSAFLQMEQLPAAMKFFSEATNLGIADLDIAKDRGLAYDLSGDPRRAQADYQLALRRGEDAEVRRRLALSLAISGDRDGALAALAEPLRRQDRAAWRTRAFVLALSGDAEAATQAAMKVMPGQAAAMRPFFARLPSLSPAQRAMAVHLGQMPDGPSLMAQAPRPDQYASAAGARTSIDAGRPDRRQPSLGTRRAASNPVRPQANASRTQAAPQSRRLAQPSRMRERFGSAVRTANGTPTQRTAPRTTTRLADARPALPRVVQEQPVPQARVNAPRANPPVNILPAPVAQSAPVSASQPAPNFQAPPQAAANRNGQLLTAAPVSTPPAAVSAEPRAPTSIAPARIELPASSAPGFALNTVNASPIAAAAPPASSSEATVAFTSGLKVAAPTAAEPAERPPAPAASEQAPFGPPTPAPVRSETASPPAQTAATPTPPAVLSAGGDRNEASAVSAAEPAPRSTGPTPGFADIAAAVAALPSVPEGQSVASEAKPEPAKAAPPKAEPEPESAKAEPKAEPKPKVEPRPTPAGKPKAEEPKPKPKAEEAKPKGDPKKEEASKPKADPKKKEEAAKPKKAEAPKEASRIWVQVAGGADKGSLPREFAKLKERAPKLLGGRTAWTTPLRATNRLLVGPFKTEKEAQEFINQLAKSDLTGFSWTSPAGQEIAKLPAK